MAAQGKPSTDAETGATGIVWRCAEGHTWGPDRMLADDDLFECLTGAPCLGEGDALARHAGANAVLDRLASYCPVCYFGDDFRVYYGKRPLVAVADIVYSGAWPKTLVMSRPGAPVRRRRTRSRR